MAKNTNPWTVQLPGDEDPLTPRRRTRNSAANTPSGVQLRRDADETTIAVGDVVLVSRPPASALNPEENYYAVVVEIQVGVANRPVVTALPFVRGAALAAGVSHAATDAASGSDSGPGSGSDSDGADADTDAAKATFAPGELVLVPVVETLRMDCVDHKTAVSSKAAAPADGLFCGRAVSRSGRTISREFDLDEWRRLLRTDRNDAVQFLTSATLPAHARQQRRVRVAPLSQRLARASPRPKAAPAWEESDSSGESEESDFSEDEPERPPKSPSKSPSKRPKSPQSSPSKRPRAPGSAASTPKRNRDAAKDTDVFQTVVNVLSPLNKGFKVKSGSPIGSLPSLRRDTSVSPVKRAQNTASEAFRDLRDKLHTSTRISSLPCREEQFGGVYVALESAVAEKTGCCIYVSGTPGTGKTATVREAIGSLRDNADAGYVDDFDFLEINCLKLLAPNAAYEQLWEHLSGFKVTPANAALLLEEHFGNAAPARKPLVLLVDELDQLVTKAQDVIYNFFNWPTYPQSKLVVVAVANTMDLPERALSNKIASRLGLRRFTFRGYTEAELGTIITHRLVLMSEQNRRKVEITPDAMRFASKKVALVSGDARRALTICRRAVEFAELEYLAATNTENVPEQEQAYSVQTRHVGMAIAEAVNSPMAQSLAELPFAAKLVLACMLLRMRRSGLGENPLGDVLDEMKNSLRLLATNTAARALSSLAENESYLSLLYAKSPGVLGVRVHHLAYIVNELEEQGLVVQQNIRSDRHRMVALNVTEEEVAAVLRKDADIAAML